MDHVFVAYKYTIPYTNIHWITALFIAINLFIIAFNVFFAFSDTSKKAKLILYQSVLMLLYNIAGGLFVDVNLPIAISVQLTIVYACAVVVSIITPYLVFVLLRSKFVKRYFLYALSFIAIPFIIFFAIGIFVNDFIAKYATVYFPYIPILFSFSLLIFMFFELYNFIKKYDAFDVWVFWLVYLFWIMGMASYIFIFAPQYVEHTISNLGFVIFSWYNIYQNCLLFRTFRENQSTVSIQSLTDKEIEVIEAMIAGYTSNKQICERLSILDSTCNSHIAHIKLKLQSPSRKDIPFIYQSLLSHSE